MNGIGATDCEALGDGWLAQPADALSSLGLTAVGIWLLVRARRGGGRWTVAVGIAALAAGIGSFLYHGPTPAGARYLHDATALGLAVALAAAVRPPGHPAGPVLAGAGLAAVAPAVWPGGGGILIAAAGGGAAVAVLMTTRAGYLPRRTALTAGAVTAVAGLFLVLGRTGGPLCAPGSLLQAHAAWHLLLAGAIALLAAGPAAQRGRS